MIDDYKMWMYVCGENTMKLRIFNNKSSNRCITDACLCFLCISMTLTLTSASKTWYEICDQIIWHELRWDVNIRMMEQVFLSHPSNNLLVISTCFLQLLLGCVCILKFPPHITSSSWILWWFYILVSSWINGVLML